MKKAILCVLLTLSMSVSAFALEVPTDTVVQNLNGSQQVIKTFTIPADQDPQSLIEQPFELEGYLYTFTDIVKTENAVEESKPHTEVITVETDKNDLAEILSQLKPTVEFDDGTFKGTLALDHTSLNTEASGYAAKSYTVSEVKTIGRLDRNDMSYVPSATVKNGRTLSLADVEWQVTGTDLVGETLVPSSYQAVATYSARVPYQAGYRIHHDRGIYRRDHARGRPESITYVLTYLGTKVGIAHVLSNVGGFFAANWLALVVGAAMGAAVIFGIVYASYGAPTPSRPCRGGRRRRELFRGGNGMKHIRRLAELALMLITMAALSVGAIARGILL